MVLAQEKYRLPDPGLIGEESTDSMSKKSRQRSRKRRPALKLNFSAQCCLASVVVGFIFMAGIALTLYYVFPARLGYQIVTLEKQIHDLEQQQKLLEVEEAQARSLGRIESIATTQMAMLPMEDREVAIAAASTGSRANPGSTGSNGGINRAASNSSSVAIDPEYKRAATVADSSLQPAAAGSESIIQATARLVSGKFMTASRGARTVPIED